MLLGVADWRNITRERCTHIVGTERLLSIVRESSFRNCE